MYNQESLLNHNTSRQSYVPSIIIHPLIHITCFFFAANQHTNHLDCLDRYSLVVSCVWSCSVCDPLVADQSCSVETLTVRQRSDSYEWFCSMLKPLVMPGGFPHRLGYDAQEFLIIKIKIMYPTCYMVIKVWSRDSQGSLSGFQGVPRVSIL